MKKLTTKLKSLEGMMLRNSTAASFLPVDLFTTSAATGVWFDPSDTTTLFQDSAGTTPVTASGQPVGRMLDKSKGLVRGPELVTNGTFDSGVSGWNQLQGTITATGGRLRVQQSAGVPGRAVSNAMTCVIGRTYRVSLEWYRGTINSAFVWVTLSATSASGAIYFATSAVDGAYEFVFTATQTTHWMFAGTGSGTDGQYAEFDNISVRELPGHHATQPTAASRPIYRRGDSRGVVNLLTWSEAFDNAAWVKQRSTITANAVVAPDGTLTADKLAEGTEAGTHRVIRLAPYAEATVFSVYLKAAERTSCAVTIENLSTGNNYTSLTNFNLTSGTVTYGTGTITPAGNGWYRCTVIAVSPATSAPFVYLRDESGDTYTGDGTSGIYIWGAQLNPGPTALPYQRNDANLGGVATGASTDLHWLETDGVDDGMVTGNIDFTGTDKVAVFAGVRKLSDAAFGVICELGTDINVVASTFSLLSGDSTSRFRFRSRGTGPIAGADSWPAYAAPVSVVLSAQADIAAPSISLSTSGVVTGSNSGDQGSGNYGNYPLYLFRRGGSSLPFNGLFYGAVVAGTSYSATQVSDMELFMSARTKEL